MRKRSAAGAVALALVSGGLCAAPCFGADPAQGSVYDRSAPARRPQTSALGRPRPLPLAGASGERPLSQAPAARGYVSQGAAAVRQPAVPSTIGPARSARSALPPTSAPRASQGVVPAFFPAPINGTGEPGRVVDQQPSASQQIALQLNSPAPGEHPLMPAVRWAKQCLQKMQYLHDYSAKMAKRERIDGTLTDYEYLKVKVRHEPFSVYIAFIGPARVKGQEAIYVKGRNDGKLLAHANGMRKIFGTVSLHPESMLAMTGNRYPITEMGIKRLTERLIEVGEHDAQFGECEVKAIPNTKINGRDCVCLQVIHPVERREFIFNQAKIYVDSELNVPVRYEAYDWPQEPGGEPLLTEEYTYVDLKLNNGFADRDFEITNPEYQFR